MAEFSFKDSIVSDDISYVGTGSLTLDVKHLFTSFLQYVFSSETRYKWEKDVRYTKVIIADKNAIDLGVVEKRPSIILSRGPVGWSYTTRGQAALGHAAKQLDQVSTLQDWQINNAQQPDYVDLVRGSITINCISKHGLQSEEIANKAFFALTGFKNSIYKHGVHSLTGLTIGDEQILRSNSDIELTTVPITFQYTMERQVTTGHSTADVTLYYTPLEGREEALFEGVHFTLTSGHSIQTEFIPEAGSDLLVSYKESTTGATRTKEDLVGAIDGTNQSFTLPSGENAYGYYKLLGGVNFTYSGLGSTFTDFSEGNEW